MFVSIYSKKAQTVDSLGGKGYGLWWMQSQGVNVPPALVFPTSYCLEYMENPKETMEKVSALLADVRSFFVNIFGFMPLLSVRSGAKISMPGMMDTILNVGLDAETMPFWIERLGEACAHNCMSRLQEMYKHTVADVDFLPNAQDQLLNSIEAVFKSWNNERAKIYRKMHNISGKLGTAVTIQAMVFGNFNNKSGTGVLFTRNPDTGEAKLTGEFLVNAQGEDVVAGTATPMPLTEMCNWNPEVSGELEEIALNLELLKNYPQDIEFTIQDDKLYILQTRNAKMSAKAKLRVCLDMVKEGNDTSEMLKRVTARDYWFAQQDQVDPKFKVEPVAVGIPACSGVVTGKAVYNASDAINCKEPCILVTEETNPDDIGGMIAAKGVLTMKGGATSHAAVVARGMNKPCVVGVGLDVLTFLESEKISIDGATGRVWLGEVPVISGESDGLIEQFDRLMFDWTHSNPILVDGVHDDMVMDVSTDLLSPENVVVDRVLKVINKCQHLTLSFIPSPEWSVFYNVFGSDKELVILEELKSSLNSYKLERLCVLSRNEVKIAGIKYIQDVSSNLELMIMTKGYYICDGELTEAQKRVIEWKKDEAFEFPVDRIGGYVCKDKLIQTLLG